MVILSTAAGMHGLAQDLLALAERGGGRIQRTSAEEHDPDTDGYLTFQIVSEQDLAHLQTSRPTTWKQRHGLTILIILIGSLTLYGGYSLLSAFSSVAEKLLNRGLDFLVHLFR